MTATLERDGAGPAGSAPVAAAPLLSLDGARAAESSGARIRGASALGLGTAVTWLSLLVLIPLAAVVSQSFSSGWTGFWDAITAPAAVHALVLTVWTSLGVAAINAVMGTLLAWVLVRDRFWGRRAIELVIDIPFALPTIVAGLVLLAMYGTDSPFGINLLGTQRAILFAMTFVTLPFVVRSVQPVLMALDPEAEQAAACLGAGPLTSFRRIVLPLLLPAVASGSALAFARAIGEYGTVLLISGGLPRATTSPMYAMNRIAAFDYTGAAATATVLLAVSLLVILGLDLLQRRVARRG